MNKFKICTKCGLRKQIKEFHKTTHKHKTSEGHIIIYNYHQAKCKACRNEEKREYNSSHQKEIAIYNLYYRETFKGKIRSYNHYERKHRSVEQISSQGGMAR